MADMELLLPFILGIVNFALQKAVTESGHPALDRMPRLARHRSGKIMLAVEYAILVGVMLAAEDGWGGAVWGYAIYTAMNGLAAWSIVTKRM
ncbi:hypothetical protein [Pseudopontixanthobacter vadosimaris]|uniref:hypothetical protein n=1 Tax=Pseudopontixanthobacter vadosimaris TaxID=2726450 RepID=UPI001474C823|nr:hypothetical protein [Pseudopontixanthobacter vadosimaris]